MKSALIGYTGFVGSNIMLQNKFTDYYNSKNINEIRDKSYDLLVSCANSSLIWKTNLEPEKDWGNIQNYIKAIQNVKANHFVLLSSVEVYDVQKNIDEFSKIDITKLKPYGKHRYLLEQFVKKNFKKSTIIRLPNLFGKNLKKNFVYDLMYDNNPEQTNKDSNQQWYNLDNIWKDIKIAIEHNLPLVNFSVEPISAHELAKFTLGIEFNSQIGAVRDYDMRSKYAKFYNSNIPYLYNKKETLKSLKEFMQKK